MRVSDTMVIAVAVSGIIAVGCNRTDDRGHNPNRGSVTDQSSRGESAAVNQPMTVSGCLQRQDQLIDEYVLTQQPRSADAPVATGGSTAVEREQVREAMRSYHLKGKRDDLEKLVGSEVRVTGTV